MYAERAAGESGGAVANGVGSGEGAIIGVPSGTFPDAEATTIVKPCPGASAPCSMILPIATGTLLLALGG
jgi:hypothetical protein